MESHIVGHDSPFDHNYVRLMRNFGIKGIYFADAYLDAGHGNVRAHPDFQLFATRRTLGGAKMVSGNAGLLEKLWLKITLETLKHSELKEIVTTR